MEKLDLSFYLEPPELNTEGVLEITALAPLSMVASQPGTYFRTALKPPVHMVYGMIENALGWHFPLALRKEILKGLAKKAKNQNRKNNAFKDHPWLQGKPTEIALTSYFSLLQYHLEIAEADDPQEALTYDDLWSMHLRDRGMNYIGGSRIYDYRLEELITNLRTSASEFKKMDKKEAKARAAEKYEVGDRKEFVRIPIEELTKTEERKINASSLGDRYPMYYVSPKKRGFVVPTHAYRMPFKAATTVYNLLNQALATPTAPTYLGTSEGWVSVKLSDDGR